MKLFAISCILLLGLVTIQPIAAADGCQGKQSWPELVGREGNKAAAIIEKENAHVRAVLVLPNAVVTTDFRCDRVRVYINKDGGVVIRIPTVG